MQVPLEIVFEGIDPSEFVEAKIRGEVDRLERFSDRITSCRVVVDAPHRHHKKGNLYLVRIHMTLPGGREVTINRNAHDKHAHEDAHVAIRDAFRAARRRLQDETRRAQGKVKVHEVPPHGRVAKLFAEESYGFIASSDGRDIYFHANSVANGAFARLSVGDEVRFEEEAGDKGAQATVVKPVGKHHVVAP